MTDREIDRALGAQQVAPPPLDRVKRIEAAIVGDLKPVRPIAPDSVYLTAFAGIFIAVCVIGCYVVGQYGWHTLNSVQKVCIFAPLVVSIAFLLLSMVRQMTPAAKQVRSSALIAAGSFVFLLLIMAILFRPVHEQAFLPSGLACFRTGMTYAVPAAFLFALLLLRGAGLSPLLTGATAGGLAGLLGLGILEIHCPNLNVYHIVVWHVSVTLVCALGGLVFSSVTFRCWTTNH